MPPTPNARTTAAWAVLLLGACGRGEPSASTYATRDSSGVEIVEDAAPSTTATDVWSFSAEPLVQIGLVEGDSAYQLFRVTGARRLSDGRIVVANAGTQQLRFFDDEGRFIRSSGGQGDGPGEFRTITDLFRFGGDSLLAYDRRNRRISVFGPTGEFAHDLSLADIAEGAPPTVEGVLSDGTLVVGLPVHANPDANGYKRDTLEVALLPPDAGTPKKVDLGRFPGADMLERRTSAGGGVVNVQEGTIPFARATWVAVGHDDTYVGTSDTYEVLVYGRDGTSARVIRRTDRPPQPMTDEILGRFIDDFIQGITSNRVRTVGAKPNPDAIRKTWEALPRVPALPTHGDMLVDAVGDLWVQDYASPWESDDAKRWSVYDPDGRLLGEMHTPAGFEVFDIDRDALLGLARDSLDVEHVQLWGLTRR